MTNPPEGTAVAKRAPEFPAHIQNALDLTRMSRAVAKEVAKLSWGAALTREACEAIAAWGQQHAVDVTTEIHILGNRIYLNADFYKRKLGEMVAANLVDGFKADFIHHDTRLEKMAKDGDQEALTEMHRRQKLRIQYNVPEGVEAACVFSLKLKALDTPIVGVKWCGKGSGRKDPVGEQFPTETSETRAIRRALKLAVSHVPSIATKVGPAELAAKALESSIGIAHEQVKEELKVLAATNRPTALKPAEDPYAEPVVSNDPAQIEMDVEEEE